MSYAGGNDEVVTKCLYLVSDHVSNQSKAYCKDSENKEAESYTEH